MRAKELRSHQKSPTNGRSRSVNEAVEIRNRIVECNLRLAVSLARHYTAPERPVEDLVSEATLPLIRCVESFDSRRGTRFQHVRHAGAHELVCQSPPPGLPSVTFLPGRKLA